MRSMLVGVTPTDPLTYSAIVAAFLSIAMLASFGPARRASKLDPMTAMREE
jgi:ABC-type lipoprotein release transport system permease subunit